MSELMQLSKRDDVIPEWFREHVATLHEMTVAGEPLQLLVWKRPDSGICRIEYMVRRGTLYISGDLGDAVFQWSSRVDLAWIANCSLGYFLEKCQASEQGRRFRDWDEDEARAYVAEHWKGRAEWNAEEVDCEACADLDDDGQDACEACRGLGVVERALPDEKRELYEDLDGDAAIYDRGEWHAWLRENGQDVFGNDWWEGFPSAGDVPTIRAVSWLYGLQMAMQQLAQKAAA